MDRFIVGCEGIDGAIDPVEGFIVSDDGLNVLVQSAQKSTLGGSICSGESSRSFLERNHGFYIYDTRSQTYLRDTFKELKP